MLERIGDWVVGAVERRPARIALLLAIFVVFAMIEAGIVVFAEHLPLISHGILDCTIHGGLALLAAWLLLEGARERRARIRAGIQQSAELNHEIRNALEVIGQAGYLVNDVVYGRAITESVERIRKTLDRTNPE